MGLPDFSGPYLSSSAVEGVLFLTVVALLRAWVNGLHKEIRGLAQQLDRVLVGMGSHETRLAVLEDRAGIRRTKSGEFRAVNGE